MVKGTVEESGGLNPHIKAGSYLGRLAGVFEKTLKVTKVDEVTKTATIETVDRWEWTFGVRTKEGDQRFTVLTSPKISTKSKAYGFINALKGSTMNIGEDVDTDELVGKYANLTIKDKQKNDRLGNIQVTSEIADVVSTDVTPDEEIVIEGLAVSDEDEGEDSSKGKAAKETPPAEPSAASAKTANLPSPQAKKSKK